jgi:hypothetical protein
MSQSRIPVVEVTMRARAEPIGMVRRLSLAVTDGLHRLVLGGSAVALGGLPRAGGLPVLRGAGTGPQAREQLEAALELLARLAPGLRDRLQRHVLGIFLTHRPRGHGHYSRITGTCILDLDQLAAGSPAGVAAALVRCATEGWLWRSGRGRTTGDEARILVISEMARRHFLLRAGARSGAPL